jgi:hypothetical protein
MTRFLSHTQICRGWIVIKNKKNKQLGKRFLNCLSANLIMGPSSTTFDEKSLQNTQKTQEKY